MLPIPPRFPRIVFLEESIRAHGLARLGDGASGGGACEWVVGGRLSANYGVVARMGFFLILLELILILINLMGLAVCKPSHKRCNLHAGLGFRV